MDPECQLLIWNVAMAVEKERGTEEGTKIYLFRHRGEESAGTGMLGVVTDGFKAETARRWNYSHNTDGICTVRCGFLTPPPSKTYNKDRRITPGVDHVEKNHTKHTVYSVLHTEYHTITLVRLKYSDLGRYNFFFLSLPFPIWWHEVDNKLQSANISGAQVCVRWEEAAAAAANYVGYATHACAKTKEVFFFRRGRGISENRENLRLQEI